MVVVNLNGTAVKTRDLVIEDVLTSQPNGASFTLTDPASEPVAGQEVFIYRDTPDFPLFGGVIVQTSRSHPAPGAVSYLVQCSDYQRLLDRELVFAAYDNMSCKAIIEAMIAEYTDPVLSFTTAHVQDGPVVAKAVFNYRPVSQCIRELAGLVNYDWYVDELRDIHFFEQETTAAPFDLDDAALAAKVDGYRITPDYSQVRNRVYVRGGYTLSDPYTEIQTASDGQAVFKLGYKPHSLSVEVDGISKTVGIEFIDDETSDDCLMNYQESTVRFSRYGTLPGAGAVMAFTYLYEVPVLVLVQDHTSQQVIAALEGGTGVYEHVVVDNTLRSREEAYNLGQSEIVRFANPLVSGSFTTCVHGFMSGQTLRVNVTGERYNGKYRIRNVTAAIRRGTELAYTVTYATTLFDLVEVLAGLIREQRRVQLREDEIVDRLEVAGETVHLADVHLIDLADHPVDWGMRKWGSFTWG